MTMIQNTYIDIGFVCWYFIYNTSNKMKCHNAKESSHYLAKNEGNRNIVLVQYHKHTSYWQHGNNSHNCMWKTSRRVVVSTVSAVA